MRNGGWQPVKGSIGNLSSVKKLSEIKKAALRRRIWFKSLNKIERGIVDLTIKYVDNIKSSILAKVLTAIIDKLQTPTKSHIERLVRTIGLSIAEKISEIAIKWGNLTAKSWVKDVGFAEFLTVNIGKLRNNV